MPAEARPRRTPKRSAHVMLTMERGPHRGLARAVILRRIHAMIDALQLQDIEVSFVLTDDERIHELNKVYRHKDRPTDVLAFALREGEFAELAGPALGDVIVSVPTARRQAEERGAPVLDEVTMLLAHGLLHLLGWDHDTAAKDRRMRAETDRLCVAAATADAAASALVAAPPREKKGVSGPSKRASAPALSRQRPAEKAPAVGKKVQAPRQVAPRRSTKA